MRGARVMYDVPKSRPDWELSEETMPESVPHDEAVELLKAILAWWAASKGEVQIARNLAVRWDPARPQVGLDPDVCVLSPKPPDGENLTSVRTWLPGHSPPKLAVEVVSESNKEKDYAQAPDKYAASGTEELWIFDPKLVGPRAHGGPIRLQVWRRVAGSFLREYAGEGPAWSEALGAWAVVTEGGKRLRIAASAEGAGTWPTEAEAAFAREEAALARERASLAREEDLLAQLREAQAELAKRSG